MRRPPPPPKKKLRPVATAFTATAIRVAAPLPRYGCTPDAPRTWAAFSAALRSELGHGRVAERIRSDGSPGLTCFCILQARQLV